MLIFYTPNTPGSQVIIPGIKVMTSKAATQAQRYGTIRLLILPILVSAIPEATNRLTAIGGVIIPIDVLIIMMIPSAIGDNPRDAAIGRRMGVTSRIMAWVSRKHPKNSRITLIISSRATLLVNRPSTLDAINVGIFWFVINHPKGADILTTNSTTAELTVDFLKIA